MTSTRDPSIAELISDLSEQTSRLVRDEMRLAQKEMVRSAKHAGAGAGLFGAAGVLSLSAFAVLIVAAVAAVAALALVLPLWAAALVVAAVLLVAAGAAALIGRAQTRRVSPPVAESVESVKLDVEEVRTARERH